MIRRNTWILLIILIVLVGAAMLLPKLQFITAKSTPTPAATSQPLFQSEQSNLKELTLTQTNGSSLTITNTGAAQWSVVQPGGLVYDETTVNSAVNGFLNATVLNQLMEQPPAEAIGLAEPSTTIVLKYADNTMTTISLGSLTPAGSGYYLQKQNQPVVIVSNNVIDSLVALFTAGKPSVTATPSSTNTTPSP